MQAASEEAVSQMKNAGINFVAIDFDRTLVTEHTYGQWLGSSDELAPKVRPLFLHLVPTALDKGLCVAIVTFSGQTILIWEVLRTVFPNHWKRITLRCCDNSWGNMGTNRDGKQMFMASAAEELQLKFDVKISKETTVLIDDDGRNIEIALKKKVRAVLFLPDEVDPDKCFFRDVRRFMVDVV